MKQIESVTIWSNGQQKTASILKAKIAMDNLENSCSFNYELCEGGQGTESTPLVIGQTLAEGSVTMTGQDYLDWDNSNEAAYVYIAEKLNLTLIP
jgi:hypothetical protein